MTEAERVSTVAQQLEQWRTIREIATVCRCPTRAVGWTLRHLARSRPVFSRKRTVLVREYRMFPAAVEVRGR